MRINKVKDYIDILCKKKNDNGINEILLNTGKTLKFVSLLTFICGLNGVGKTRLLKSIYKYLGGNVVDDIKTIDFDYIKIKGKNYNKNELNNNKQFLNVEYFDSQEAEKTRAFFEQANLNELEETEGFEFNPDSIKEISFLVGKEYDYCIVFDLSDEYDGIIEYPFLIKAKEKGSQECYYSYNMGTGEHIILLLYYVFLLKTAQKQTSTKIDIFIIDEIESYISVHSQRCIVNHIAKVAVKNNIQFIVSTHSPYIIQYFPSSFINLIRYKGDEILIVDNQKHNEILDYLGFDNLSNFSPIIHFFVEDNLGKVHLETLIENGTLRYKYEVELCGGYSGIEKKIQENFNYNRIMLAIPDADMKGKIQVDDRRLIFLPGDIDLESDIISCLKDDNNVSLFVSKFSFSKQTIDMLLEQSIQMDKHDFFEYFKKKTTLNDKQLVEFFLDLNSNYRGYFMNDLKKKLENLINLN